MDSAEDNIGAALTRRSANLVAAKRVCRVHSDADRVAGQNAGRIKRDESFLPGLHLYPEEAVELGGAHAVVQGDGDQVWPTVLADCCHGAPQPTYAGGRIEANQFSPARWDLLPRNRYTWASVQTVRGCPKHCSFCSVWRTELRRRPFLELNVALVACPASCRVQLCRYSRTR